jgi:hypothetical protein
MSLALLEVGIGQGIVCLGEKPSPSVSPLSASGPDVQSIRRFVDQPSTFPTCRWPTTWQGVPRPWGWT